MRKTNPFSSLLCRYRIISLLSNIEEKNIHTQNISPYVYFSHFSVILDKISESFNFLSLPLLLQACVCFFIQSYVCIDTPPYTCMLFVNSSTCYMIMIVGMYIKKRVEKSGCKWAGGWLARHYIYRQTNRWAKHQLLPIIKLTNSRFLRKSARNATNNLYCKCVG